MLHMSYVSEAALPPVCPVQNGYVANPFNCSEYVHCLNYNVNGVGACPRNLFFSQSRGACVPYHMSNCTNSHCKLTNQLFLEQCSNYKKTK